MQRLSPMSVHDALNDPTILRTLQELYPMPSVVAPRVEPRNSAQVGKHGTNVGKAARKLPVKPHMHEPVSPRKRLPIFDGLSPDAKRLCEKNPLRSLDEYGDQLRITRQMFSEHMDAMEKTSKAAAETTAKWTQEVSMYMKVELDAITRRAFEQGHVQGELMANKKVHDLVFADGYMQGKISAEAEYSERKQATDDAYKIFVNFYDEHIKMKEEVKMLRTKSVDELTALLHCEEDPERAFWEYEPHNGASFDDLQRMVDDIVNDKQPLVRMDPVIDDIRELFDTVLC